jgi:glycosyltransferase involved in cell wall biosynthesis
MNICILSGAPIKANDGVGDFSCELAEQLKMKHKVSLLAPNADKIQTEIPAYNLQSNWGIRGCKKTMQLIDHLKPDTILVQYVPQLYGLKGGNPFFSFLLHALKRKGYDIVTVAHEFSSPLGWMPKKFLLGTAHRIILRSVVNASNKIISTTPFCLNLLKQRFNEKRSAFHYIPVGSTIMPADVDEQNKAVIRSELGWTSENFVVATFGNMIGYGFDLLQGFLTWFANENPLSRFLFLGKQSDLLKQRFDSNRAIQLRSVATGEISEEQITQFLSISNLYAVFYPDGASTRRTSLMAGLAHGMPIISNCGILTDENLASSQAIYLIKDGSTEEFNALKIRLLEEKFLPNLRQQSRVYFDKNLSWPKIAAQYFQILNGSAQ